MFQLIEKPKLRFPKLNEKEPIIPIPYARSDTSKAIAVFDTETDPFEYGCEVQPFTCHFAVTTATIHVEDYKKFHVRKDGISHATFWGDDCIEQFFIWLAKLKTKFLIYVHNGGNFDFYFMLDYVDRGTAPFIINGRLARLYMQGQEFRDSYSLIPVALDKATKGAAKQKTKIDYSLFTREHRKANKDEILAYQEDDCTALLDLVLEAHTLFGDRLTMASIALPMLRSFHGFESMGERIDETIRPFYFGGRNQCFEVGALHSAWKIYDVNSMYPHVMASALHPISATPHYESKITERTHFAKIRAYSNGALPVRGSDRRLSFPVGNGDFFASIHEINAGLETGLLRISKVEFSIWFDEQTSFREFVEHFYSMRLEADRNGDELRKLFYKLVLNSSYGKLAQDPRRYENYLFDPDEIPSPLRCCECDKDSRKNERCTECQNGQSSPFGWYPHTQRASEIIYARPSTQLSKHGFYNVATAASITGAARAYLLRGLAQAERPIYCDTDSIICEQLNADTDASRLGAWKLEAEGDTACIGGKKLYAVFNMGEPIKSASKGVKLTPQEIAMVCAGHTVDYAHPVPKFKLDGSVEFTKRSIRRTGLAAIDL